MGRYLGKCKGSGVGELAVVGVRTRARAALAMAAMPSSTTTNTTSSSRSSPSPAGKKIKKLAGATRSTRRKVENSGSSPARTTSNDDIISGDDVISDFPASCCSSNVVVPSCTTTSEMIEDRSGIVADPEVESSEKSSRHLGCLNTERKSSSSSSSSTTTTKPDELDSSTKLPDATKSTVQIKMPSSSEIEEFFAVAEKDLQKRFTDKYNFDIVKDVPLEGRYEWVQIKP